MKPWMKFWITSRPSIRKRDDNWYYEPACLKNAAAFAYCELKGIDRESGALRARYYSANVRIGSSWWGAFFSEFVLTNTTLNLLLVAT